MEPINVPKAQLAASSRVARGLGRASFGLTCPGRRREARFNVSSGTFGIGARGRGTNNEVCFRLSTDSIAKRVSLTLSAQLRQPFRFQRKYVSHRTEMGFKWGHIDLIDGLAFALLLWFVLADVRDDGCSAVGPEVTGDRGGRSHFHRLRVG